MSTLSSILFDSYRQIPDQVALTLVITGKDDEQITFRELFLGSVHYANLLNDNHIETDEIVIIILQHGKDLIFSFLGALLHGSIPSIMPYLTEKLLPERYRDDLTSLVEVTKPSAIITYKDFEAEVRASLRKGDSVRKIILSDALHASNMLDCNNLSGLNKKPDDVAFLQHSSGTTGLKKGVALSHQAVINQLSSYQKAIEIKPDDVVVSWLPLYHDMGLIAGFLMPILLQLHLVLISPFDWVRAPYRLMQAVSKYRGTLSWMPNFAYNFCAQKVRERHLEGIDLSSWRAIINCSEPTRWESHQEFLSRFVSYGVHQESLMTCYAMAENVFAVTQSKIGAPVKVDIIDREALQTKWEALPARKSFPEIRMLSSGRPIKNVEVKIIDPKGNQCEDRKVGEVALISDCMLTNYYNRPDATGEAFIDGWYRTGDFGYISDGELYVTGRKKELLIVAGKNIYPQDIEQLAMEIPGVHPGRVVAFGIYNQEIGTEDVVVVAEVDTDDENERDTIIEEVMKNVTRGSAIALRNVYLVDANWLIKTSSGKTARLANRDKYLSETQE